MQGGNECVYYGAAGMICVCLFAEERLQGFSSLRVCGSKQEWDSLSCFEFLSSSSVSDSLPACTRPSFTSTVL
jgi:hypothetical protein